MTDQGMPVGETATRLGLTVRTLHHWDEIGLARPAARSAAGYRLYTDDDLERLRRIVVYRELGLDLDAIRAVLDEPGGDVAAQLRVQRAQLTRRITQLRDLDEDLQRMIAGAGTRHPALRRGAARDVRPGVEHRVARPGARGVRRIGAVAAVRRAFRLAHGR